MSSLSSAATSSPDLPVAPGQVLEEKFRVERIIGEGAMGLVVEARHLRLDERVALKFLRPEARARKDIVARFAREARAAAKIKSDYVARVFDVGGTQDGTPFIVMEYLEGKDLETEIAKGQVKIVDAIEYVIQACEGLSAAHAIGIVHRDIKPANLFITDNGGIPQVKLLDFGISKAGLGGTTLDDIDVGAADTSEIMGSPFYMSPEQIRSTKDVDGRADIWSLGVVLYELLTGRTPVVATEVTAIIAQVLHDPHPPASSLRSDLPQGLEEVVDRCLAKDPATRYQTAADLAVALMPFGPRRAREVVERASAIQMRASGASYTPDSLPPPSSMTARRTGELAHAATIPAAAAAIRAMPPPPAEMGMWTRIAMVAVVLGLAGGTYAFVAHLRDEQNAKPPPAVAVAAVTAPASPATPSASTSVAEPLAASAASAAPEPIAPPTVTALAPIGRPAARPVPRPRPAVSTPPASTPNGDTEIRHER